MSGTLSEELRRWIPDGWQGPKELLRIAANLLAALFLAQVLGADLARIGLTPPLPWWGSGLLALAAWLVAMRISTHQEERKGGGTGGGSVPPPAPGA